MRLLAAAVFFFFFVAGAGGVAFAAVAGGLASSSPAVDTAVKAAHLLCFATSCGATVWAIYVGGLVMFLNLPRHMMGRLRGKVFPACFALSAACTAASAAAFAWLHRPWEETAAAPAGVEWRQLGILFAAVGLDLANLLLFTPRTLKVMEERHRVERGLGIGDQVFLDGWRRNARAASTDAALAAANGRFRPVHVPSAVALAASTSGLAAHSWYLAGKLAL